MQYLVRNDSNKYIAITMEKCTKKKFFVYMPFDTSERKNLPELTIKEIGVSEQVMARDTHTSRR